MLHLSQHIGQGDFDVLQQLPLFIFIDGPGERPAEARHGRPGVEFRLLEIGLAHAVLCGKPLHVVSRGRGVQQVACQRRVHGHVFHLTAQRQRLPVQGLYVVGVFFDLPAAEKGPQEGVVRRHPEQLSPVGEDEAAKRPVLVPVPVEVSLPGVLQPRQHRRAVGAVPHLRPFRRRSPLRRGKGRFGKSEFFQQGKQLQLHHKGGGLLRLSRLLYIVGHLCIDGGVPADGAQVVAQQRVLLGLFQLGPHSGLQFQLFQVIVEIGDAAVFLNQLPRALGADARHAGNTVGSVSLNGLQVDHLVRGDAVFLLDFRLVVHCHLGLAEFRGGQPHRGAAGHQLQAVPVSGGDDAGVPPLFAGGGKGAQDIVGLPAFAGDNAVPHQGEQLLQHGQLLRQLRRHALAVGLIARIGLVPEGGRLAVKRDGHRVRLRLVAELFEHGEKPVDAVGELSCFRREQLDPVKGPVQDAVAVQYQ